MLTPWASTPPFRDIQGPLPALQSGVTFLDPYQPAFPGRGENGSHILPPPHCAIFGGTSEAVRWEGSHEGMSESDGISPTITARLTCVLIRKSNSPPGLLKAIWSSLVWLEHRVVTLLIQGRQEGGSKAGRASCPQRATVSAPMGETMDATGFPLKIRRGEGGKGGGITRFEHQQPRSHLPRPLPPYDSPLPDSPAQSQIRLQMPQPRGSHFW